MIELALVAIPFKLLALAVSIAFLVAAGLFGLVIVELINMNRNGDRYK